MRDCKPCEVNIGDLNKDVLERIFALLPYEERKDVLPCVCKRWNAILQQGSELLWSHVVIDPTAGSTRNLANFAETAAWLHARSEGIRHLRMQLFDYVSTPGRRWAWASTREILHRNQPTPQALHHAAPRRPLPVWLGPVQDPQTGVHHLPRHASGSAVPQGAPIQAGFLAHVIKNSLSHLKSLYIMKCSEVMSLRDYRAFGLLTQLESLTVLNYIDDVPVRGQTHCASDFTWLAHMAALTSLHLEMTIEGFPNTVCQLDGLQHLQLKHLSNPEVPDELSRLTVLTHLTLADCSLCCVPDVVCSLPALVELSLALNDLTPHWDDEPTATPPSFPSSMTKLTSLRTLTLTCCDMETLPDVIGHLTSLQELYLSGNRVLSHTHAFFMLPSTVVNLKNVRNLCLSCCKLEAIPLELASLSGLVKLNLSNNYIYDLPTTMGSLSKLQALDLRHNRIHFFPSVITRLVQLVELDISHNKVQYDETAVLVAMLPKLEAFKFPSACETFGWCSAGGLGEMHGVSSAHHFAKMLMVLTSRKNPALLASIASAMSNSTQRPRVELLSFYANILSQSPSPPPTDPERDSSVTSDASDSDSPYDASTESTAYEVSEDSRDFDVEEDNADDDLPQLMAAVRILGPLQELDDPLEHAARGASAFGGTEHVVLMNSNESSSARAMRAGASDMDEVHSVHSVHMSDSIGDSSMGMEVAAKADMHADVSGCQSDTVLGLSSGSQTTRDQVLLGGDLTERQVLASPARGARLDPPMPMFDDEWSEASSAASERSQSGRGSLLKGMQARKMDAEMPLHLPSTYLHGDSDLSITDDMEWFYQPRHSRRRPSPPRRRPADDDEHSYRLP